MIDQFHDLINLSNACSNFSEITITKTEVNALQEGVSTFVPRKIILPENQLKILISDESNPLIKYIFDQSTKNFSAFGRDLIESTESISPDNSYLFEYFSRFDSSNPPKNFKEILSEKLNPLSYFIFVQELFDSYSTIPSNMKDEQEALSDIIEYVLLHSKKLSLAGNISNLNNELLNIAKEFQGTNLEMFKPLFENCFLRSIIRNNQINEESINYSKKCLIESSGANQSLLDEFTKENDYENSLLNQINKFIYYECFLHKDKAFYPYGEIIDQVKAKTNILIDKTGNLITPGSHAKGCYLLKIIVNWEKKFKGTRLSNASYIEISYQKVKQTIEINNSKKDKKIGSSNDVKFTLEIPYIEVVLPAFTKSDDKIEISLLYIKEKFNDTDRKKVPPEGIGTLASFTFQLDPSSRKSKSSGNLKKSKNSKLKSESSFELNVIGNNDSDDQPFIVEFKRKEKALSTKCGSISLQSKFYDLQGDNFPELFQSNIYLKNRGFDNLQLSQFLDFYIGNLVNEWIIGKPATTESKSNLISIFPPQQYYIGLIEFSMRYSIPASSIFLHISKMLLTAWCHAECYLNAFTSMFLSANVCLLNNNEKFGSLFLSNEEEEIYRYIIKFLEKNVPFFVVQHLSKPALYEKHAFLPLFMLLSFVIPDNKIEVYVDELVEKSHKNIIRSITGNLKPTKLEEKSSKVLPEVEELMKYADTSSMKKNNEEEEEDNEIDLTEVTFSIEAISETLDILNKKTKQLNKFYENSSLPNFINQWESIKGEFCKFTLALIKMYMTKQNRNDCIDQSVFKIIFSYRDLYTFFKEKDTNKNEKHETISDEFSPFKLFFDVILDWIGKIGEQMIIWTSNAVKFDTFEIDDKKLKTSSSPKDLMEVFRQSFNFIGSLNWDDPNIEIFVMTFLSLCGSCMRNYTDTLTLKMLSYFPIKIIKEAQIEDINNYISDLESERKIAKKQGEIHGQKENVKITPRKIFVIINDIINLRQMWNNFLLYVKKLFPSFFPNSSNDKTSTENQNENKTETENENKDENENEGDEIVLNDENSIELPSQVMDPLPKLTNITNSIPTLFSRLTSHLVTDTVSPHLWVKNSSLKTVFSTKASQFILNPEFFTTGSAIYASIFDKILIYIKERIDDINATTCMRYYKTMIISFLFGLDSGMMNLLVMHPTNDEPIKNKRLTPILKFIKGIYSDVFEYINQTAIEKSFADENIENYTPHSQFMFKHIKDDPEKLVNLVKSNFSADTINGADENDPDFLTVMCAFIIVSSQTNEKRQNVREWINNNKSKFVGKHFYPPKYK